MRYAFHHATVAHEDVGVVVNDAQTVFIKFGSQDFFGQSHAYCVGNTLSQWAGCSFHAVGVAVFGMTGGFAMQLAEIFQIINGNVVAGQVQQAVIPIGAPGWPELAFCTASTERKRIAFAS